MKMTQSQDSERPALRYMFEMSEMELRQLTLTIDTVIIEKVSSRISHDLCAEFFTTFRNFQLTEKDIIDAVAKKIIEKLMTGKKEKVDEEGYDI